MTLALDPSALVWRYVPGPHRAFVDDAMANDAEWCISDLGRSELLLAVHRIAGDPWTAAELAATARADLDAMIGIPIDSRCLARAVELGNQFGLRTVDAVHLGALDRLPRPLRLVTLDRRQIPAAVALDIEVVTPMAV